MPRVRFRLPLEVEVSPETLDAGRAVGDLVARIAESDLPGAVFRAVHASRRAVRARRRRPRP
jgi:hypothetical protein